VVREISTAVEGDTSYDTEFRVVWADGTIHALCARGKVYRDQAGHPLRDGGRVLGRTARRVAEERLQTDPPTQATNEALGRSLFVSHDLRAPLRAIGAMRASCRGPRERLDDDAPAVG